MTALTSEGQSRHKAVDAALRLLARRARTAWELRQRLTRAGFSPEDVEYAVARLTDVGYVRERDVAEQVVEEALNRRPVGRWALRARLQARGVNEQLIQETLASLPADELELARRALAWYVKHHPEVDVEPGRVRRVIGFLRRRGFRGETIFALLEEKGMTVPAPERDTGD